MAELLAPSAALRGAFVLPRQHPTAAGTNADGAANAPAADRFSTRYALPLGDDFGLLLPPATVATLIDSQQPVCRLPNTPPWFRGMLNVNGAAVALFALEPLLQIEPAPSPQPQPINLVIGQGQQAVAVSLSRPPLRVRLGEGQKLSGKPPLPPLLKQHSGDCYRNDRLWVDWDVGGFFAALAQQL